MSEGRLLSITWVGVVLLGLAGHGWAETAPKPGPEPKVVARLQTTYGALPLSFEANQGQATAEARFLARGTGYTLWLTATDVVLALKPGASQATETGRTQRPDGAPTDEPATPILRLQLLKANHAPKVTGDELLPGKVHYFLGNDPKQWRTNIPTYAKIRYHDVYPGIDLVYYGYQRQLEYDFIVTPGADPQTIALGFAGADRLEVDADGDLILHMAGGELRLKKPLIYQESEGVRQAIAGGYRLRGKQRVGFHVAAFDRSRPLVLDPVLAYSTYLGGSGWDTGYAIAVDAAGNAYVTGETLSSDFPTANALQPAMAPGSSTDAFIAKLDASGTALLYSTYLGGNNYDGAYGIAVDSAGTAYVTGYTYSADFPTMHAVQPAFGAPPAANQPAFGGGSSDAFVAKLDPTGSALVYSSYLGGSSQDQGNSIAVDSAGNAHVTGETWSSDFPTAQALQPTKAGPSATADAFIAKLDASGTALLYSTYLGGSNGNWGNGIAVDAAGNAYVTGLTGSTDFPTVNAVQPAFGGGSSDAFVAKLDPTGSALLYSTYLGGNTYDRANGIAVDSAGNAYVTGDTYSADFPTANPLQAAIGKATVYKSRDGGQSWSASGLSNLGVAALAIDRTNSSTLYAGTQGSGMFKSTDGGGSWTAVSAGLTDPWISDLAIDPLTPSTLYAGTSNSGVFKSTDGGEIWHPIGPPVGGPLVRSVAIDPAVPTTLYAAVRLWVMKSLDGGATWTYGGPGGDYVNDVEIDPVVPSTIYAGVTRNTPSGGGLYRSRDGGATWSFITGSVVDGMGRHDDVGTVAIDLSNTSILYIAARAGGIFKTTDGSLNWVPVNVGLTNPDVGDLAIDRTNSSVLYAGTGGGVFKSTDGGGSWTAVNAGLDNHRVTTLAIDPADPTTLYAGTGGGFSDAFLAKLDATGSTLVYSTYLGGDYYDEGHGVAVDSQGNAYVTGLTRSFSFPTANALQPNFGGASDAFIAKFNPAGAALIYSTYLGGSDDDFGYGIAVDFSGNAHVTGWTRSPDFPTVNPLQPSPGSTGDAFVAKITDDQEPSATPRP